MKTVFNNGQIIPAELREPVVIHQPIPWIWSNPSSKDMATYRDNGAARTWCDSGAWRGIVVAVRRVTQRGDAVCTFTVNALPVTDTSKDYITDRYWGQRPPQ